MIKDNFSKSIRRGSELYTFSNSKQGKGKLKSFQDEREALNFAHFLFAKSDSQSLALLSQLSTFSATNTSAPLKVFERQNAQIQALANSLANGKLFCFVEVSSPSLSSPELEEVVYEEAAKEEKAPSDGKSEEAQENESASSDSETPVSAKEHETGGDPVSMVTGEELLSLEDFTNLEGLKWVRHYRSSLCPQDQGMGLGWRHSYCFDFLEIRDEEENVESWRFVDDLGDTIEFLPVGKGAISYQIRAGASCLHHANGYRIVTLSDGTQYKFFLLNDVWKLIQIRDITLKQIDLKYSSNGRLIELHSNSVLALYCQYDKEGQLIGLRCPNTEVLVVEYTVEEGELTSASNQSGLVETYTYRNDALLLTRKRSSGFTHYFEWQGDGKNAKCIRNYGDNNTYDYRFVFGDGESSYIDTLGNRWLFNHDNNGKLLKKTSPEGRIQEWQYDELGRLAKEIQPDGTFTEHFYNKFGQLAVKRRSSGAVTQYRYDESGRPEAIVTPDGQTSRRKFNSLGQLVSSADESQTSSQYHYDKKGRLIERTQSNGNRERWWWNEQNQLQGLQTNGTLIRYSHNQSNQINGMAYPDGMFVTLEQNDKGQLIRQRTFHDFDKSVCREHSYSYDNAGRITAIQTPSGLTGFEWGELSQPEGLNRSDGSGLYFQYDGERNLKSIHRSDNLDYRLELSPDGLLTQAQGFDGIKQHYQYDVSGRISELQSGNRAVKITYNAHGDIASLKAKAGHTFNECHFQHSHGGKLLHASNESTSLAFEYNERGLLTAEWQSTACVRYQYNGKGLCEALELPSGEFLHFGYDEFGRLTTIARAAQSRDVAFSSNIEIQYDQMGRLASLNYGDNLNETRAYDGIGRLKSQEWGTRSRQYRYDVAHNLASYVDNELGHTHFHYDKLTQLTRVKTPDDVYKYQFDSFGNPVGDDIAVEQDRILEFEGLRYHYDDQGNQIKVAGGDHLQRREFNALNQLVTVNHNGKLAHYEYDALGRRSKKTTETGVTQFIWQGSKLIGEVTQSSYRWYLYQPNSHAPLMLVMDEQCYFYQNDHLGTPIRMVDLNGKVVWQASYNPQGQASIEVEEVANPIRFQGQYFDQESGLHYNLARYYDPLTGRFIQPDPIGLLGGINHYQYAPNPVMWIDPSGLCCEEPDAAVKAGEADSQPEKRVVYAMGSGNLLSTSKVNNPTYQLHTTNSHANTDAAIEAIHIALDGLGLIPAVGIFADGLNAGLYALQGDKLNAGLSLTSAIPIVGQGATAAKYANKAIDLADTASDTKGIVSTAKTTDVALNVTPKLDKLEKLTESVTNPNTPEGLAKLRRTHEVNESNLQVEAVLEHNGKVFYDTNQTARNVANATNVPLPIYSEKRALAGKPNNTTSDAHAEIGALAQSYSEGNRGGEAVLTIHGKDACSFCQSDLKKMSKQLELQRLEVRQPSNTVVFDGPEDFKPTKKGGLRWPN
ncbi:type IV secretion protein Rhs [Vibrio sp. vnigr-6D03]|uniref:RHS repeat-associated core domain-containing protein n=1 Tax=Vibrio sp. vnigr-6D03 TaxID=2058088 RepID=UPI000C33710E|nr:RHS repeat-associated core domain-containing protein [Vibrio sp. vnigr-6D03]PKF76753.1 type IV secretion protein Rhs [Vibrio sp. vnigr-6D03]